MTQKEMMADIVRMAEKMRAMVNDMVETMDKRDRQLEEINEVLNG